MQYQLVRSAPQARSLRDGGWRHSGHHRPWLRGQADRRADPDDPQGPGERGLGPRADLIYARTGWDGEGLEQQINQIGGYLTLPGADASRSPARHSHRTRGLRLMCGPAWAGIPSRLSVPGESWCTCGISAAGTATTPISPRGSSWCVGSPSPAPRGSARWSTAPAILAGPEQDVRDFQAALGWNRARLGFQVAYARISAFSPPAYAEFPRIAVLAPAPKTDWITASARIAPLQWITFEGWYSDPRGVTPEGIPPTLSMASATIRSKFLRKFPSGIFDLKLRLALESWGTGVIGRDTLGVPVTLRGATFLRSLVQIQLAGSTSTGTV